MQRLDDIDRQLRSSEQKAGHTQPLAIAPAKRARTVDKLDSSALAFDSHNAEQDFSFRPRKRLYAKTLCVPFQ